MAKKIDVPQPAAGTEVKGGSGNLQFLRDFMALKGISVPEAAQELGYTRHAILKWFRNDDAQLSTVQDLIARYGYSLVLSYRRPDTGSVQISLPDEPQGAGRLAFLDRGLKLAGLSRKGASQLLGLSDASVSYWLRVDDCAISHLFEFAEKTGMVLSIEIRKR